jgi:hypothetical protein
MLDFTQMVEGVPADLYQEIMNAERREWLAPEGMYEALYDEYHTGLFSPGRPGILAHELDEVYRAKDQKIQSHVIGETPSEKLFEYVFEALAEGQS